MDIDDGTTSSNHLNTKIGLLSDLRACFQHPASVKLSNLSPANRLQVTIDHVRWMFARAYCSSSRRMMYPCFVYPFVVNESLPWVEKYRPSDLRDVVSHQSIIRTSMAALIVCGIITLLIYPQISIQSLVLSQISF